LVPQSWVQKEGDLGEKGELWGGGERKGRDLFEGQKKKGYQEEKDITFNLGKKKETIEEK